MQIDCIEVRRELSNYIENDVTPDLRRQMEEHFSICPGCTAIYDGVRNIIRLVADGHVLELPPGFSRRLYLRLTAAAAN